MHSASRGSVLPQDLPVVARCTTGLCAWVVWGWPFGVAWQLGFGVSGDLARVGVVDVVYGLGFTFLHVHDNTHAVTLSFSILS